MTASPIHSMASGSAPFFKRKNSGIVISVYSRPQATHSPSFATMGIFLLRSISGLSTFR